MSAKYQSISPISYQRDVFPQPITALAFDPLSDTLWTGSNSGNVVAYYTAQGMRGVSFPVGGGLAVKDLTATDSNIRAFGVASEGIGAWGKGGVNHWYYRYVPVLLYGQFRFYVAPEHLLRLRLHRITQARPPRLQLLRLPRSCSS